MFNQASSRIRSSENGEEDRSRRTEIVSPMLKVIPHPPPARPEVGLPDLVHRFTKDMAFGKN
jgi:hypothetical protein